MNIDEQVGSWYHDTYHDKSSARYITFKEALVLLYQHTPTPTIVETGTVRLENDYGAGYSTCIFGECVSKFGGRLYTIDNNVTHMTTSRRLTHDYQDNISYILSDSITYLYEQSLKEDGVRHVIDLLYLDSYDCPIVGDARNAQRHNLLEFLVSEPLLHRGSIVLIDDVDFENGGKAKLTHQYLHSTGEYTLCTMKSQSVWIKK